MNCYISYFVTFIIATISCSMNNYTHEQKNESCMALSIETLYSRNDRPWLVPISSSYSLKIFFILISSFKISSLVLKDCIFSFHSFLDKFLQHIFALFSFCLIFFCLWFSAFLLLFVFGFFISFFCTILIRNIFYHIGFFTRHILVIKSALIILLQARSQECLRWGSSSKPGYNIFRILWNKISWKHTNNFSKYHYPAIQFIDKGNHQKPKHFYRKKMLFSFAIGSDFTFQRSLLRVTNHFIHVVWWPLENKGQIYKYGKRNNIFYLS